MRRIVNIFVDDRERAALPYDLELLARYDGFVVAEPSEAQVIACDGSTSSRTSPTSTRSRSLEM